MPEHLNREQISALLDEPQGVRDEELEHLSGCPDCAREYEQMSRMRMALSGLPDMDPPAGEWDAVQERLGLKPLATAGVTPIWQRAMGWPLQVAAVIALFAAGLMVGQRFNPGAEGTSPQVAMSGERSSPAVGEPGADAESLAASEPAAAYLRTVADLQHLRTGLDMSAPRPTSPEAFAERITRLDAMIDASRDALRQAPADPVLNNFLFQLVDEREDLAGQLDQTLRMTAAEY
jgi:anti-sigma factor RsiW